MVGDVSKRQGADPAGIMITHPANWGGYKLELLEQSIRAAGLVWTEEEAQAYEQHSKVASKGFGSVAEYREEMVRSYGISHDNDMKDGVDDFGDQWVLRQNDILGPFMVRGGKVVYGATTAAEAEAKIESERDAFEQRSRDANTNFAGQGAAPGEWKIGTNRLGCQDCRGGGGPVRRAGRSDARRRRHAR